MNLKKSLICSSLLFALGNFAEAHEALHEHPAAAAKPLAGQTAAATPLAARFDLKVNKTQTDWYLWRDADRVETANSLTGQNTLWQRNSNNEYSYRRVFHKDQRVVDYTPGEVKTRHAEPDWSKLASVISPSLLEALKRGPSKTLFGQKAVRYSGTVGGQKIDLWWLEQAQIPAQLHMVHDKERMQLDLKELRGVSPATWPRANEEKIAAYGLIDAADFGDMENDPFVARVMQQDGHGHSH